MTQPYKLVFLCNENFVKYIDKNRIASFDKKINNIKEIYKNFTQGDMFEYKVVQSQNYEFYEYINIIKTHGSSFGQIMI